MSERKSTKEKLEDLGFCVVRLTKEECYKKELVNKDNKKDELD